MKISVVIPVFNGADVVNGAIESVRRGVCYARQYEKLDIEPEVLIVDDRSTDGTREVVARHIEGLEGYRLLVNAENRGAGFSRNEGARASTGELIFFLDADDYLLDTHISACVKGLLQYPEVDWVKTGVLLADQILPYWHAILENSLPINLCVRRMAHDFVGGFFDAAPFRVFHVEDCYYRTLLAENFKGLQVNMKTVFHSRRPGNAFDRQYTRFSHPPGVVPDALTPEERVAQPAALEYLKAKQEELRLRRAGTITNAQTHPGVRSTQS